MDAAAVLALLGDLYAQVSSLSAENAALRARLTAQQQQEGGEPS